MWRREREREREREKMIARKPTRLTGPDAGDDPSGLGSGILMVPAIDCRRVSY
jgi:hypothetical protein